MSAMSEFMRILKPDVALSVEPEVATFNPVGGRSVHVLRNEGEKRLAVKILCSNNTTYRVLPVMMFIDPGKRAKLSVTRLPGHPKVDKLVVQFTGCSLTARKTDEIRKIYDSLDASKEVLSTNISLKVKGHIVDLAAEKAFRQ